MDTRKGDIPETDEELEKMLKKPVKRLSKKTQTIINDVAKIEDYVGKELTSTEEVEQAIEMIVGEQELQQRQEWDAANRAIAPDLVHGSPAVEEFLANHEPGQPLPEDQAERAASGSGWQGEEIPDGELEQHVQEAKKAYRKSRGLTIDSARASEIAAEKGLDDNGKAVKPARVAKAAVRADARATSLAMLRQQKALKPVVLDGNLQEVTDKKLAKAIVRSEQRKNGKGQQNKYDRAPLTAEMVLSICEDAHGGMTTKALAEKYNISTDTAYKAVYGVPYVRKMLEKAGYSHPAGSTFVQRKGPRQKAPAIQCTREQVLEMVADRKAGMKISEITKKFFPDTYDDAHYNTVRSILNGESYTDLSGLTSKVQPETKKA